MHISKLLLNINPFSNQSTKPSPHKRKTKRAWTQTSTQNYEELVPSILPLLKENIRLGQAGFINHSNLFIPDERNEKKKKRSGQKQ